MFITRSAQDIARDAVQIFGGRGITKSGMGKHIEHVRTGPRFPALFSDAEDAPRALCSTTEPSLSILFSVEVSLPGRRVHFRPSLI